MRKAQLFIVFTIILGAVTLAFKEYNQRNEPHPFLPWILIGSFAGLIVSSLWNWRFYPRTSEARKMSPIASTFSFAVVIAMGFFGMSLMNLSVQMKKAAQEVQSWPSTEATIEGQHVYQKPSGKTGQIWWAPSWSYTYEVHGKVYHSHSMSAENAYALFPKFHPLEAQNDLQQRPLGSKVRAFYNPDSPEISALDKRTDIPTERYLIFAVGFIILLMSCVGAFKIAQAIQTGEFK